MPVPPDVAYEDYAFRSSTTDMSRAQRTPIERINQAEINVREFGDITAGATCRTTIQKAFDSALPLYFPRGYYDIDQPILIPNDAHRRVIRGAGPGYDDSGTSTIIRGDFRDYLWKTQQFTGAAISSISNMGFHNLHNPEGEAAITSPDPPGASGTTSEGILAPGNGMGCLYLQLSFMQLTNMFFASAGVGLHFPGINNVLTTFLAQSGYDGPTTKPFSCGIWGSSCEITHGKILGCRYGIVIVQGPATLREMDIELCQYGVNVTGCPLPFWDRNTANGGAPQPVAAYTNNPKYVTVNSLNFEAWGAGGGSNSNPVVSPIGTGPAAAIAANVVGGGIFTNITGGTFAPEQIGKSSHGIRIDGGENNIWENVYISGSSTTGLEMTQPTTNFTFKNCQMLSYGGTQWLLHRASSGNPGNRFHQCNISGALPFAGLPQSPPFLWGVDEQICSDCFYQTFDNSTTPPTCNVGRACESGGANIVKVRWQPLIVEAATAVAFPHGDGNYQNITMAVANPGGAIKPGMTAYNKTQGYAIMNGVDSYIGTTLRIVPNGNEGPAGNAGDVIAFAGWFIAG